MFISSDKGNVMSKNGRKDRMEWEDGVVGNGDWDHHRCRQVRWIRDSGKESDARNRCLV